MKRRSDTRQTRQFLLFLLLRIASFRVLTFKIFVSFQIKEGKFVAQSYEIGDDFTRDGSEAMGRENWYDSSAWRTVKLTDLHKPKQNKRH